MGIDREVRPSRAPEMPESKRVAFSLVLFGLSLAFLVLGCLLMAYLSGWPQFERRPHVASAYRGQKQGR